MKTSLSICLLLLSLYGTAQFRLKADSSKVAALNTETWAEAYPFLSADGLRLYYTGGENEIIFLSERKSLDSPFVDGRLLSRNLPRNLNGASLTADELEIYLFDIYRTYYSKRNSVKDEFTKPVVVRELGTWHTSPSVSPDGKELMAIYTKDTVQHFRKNSAGVFTITGTLDHPKGFAPAAGQFSKDGLSYIMTVNKRGDDQQVDSILILKYSRSSLNLPFKNYEVIFNELPQKPFQITMDAGQRILIAVLNTGEWKWELNNLVYYIIEKGASGKHASSSRPPGR